MEKKRKKTQMYNVRDEREREYDPKYRGRVDMMVCVIFMPMYLIWVLTKDVF